MKMSEFNRVIKKFNDTKCKLYKIVPHEMFWNEKVVRLMTGLVDYGCNFKNGKCKFQNVQQCCCIGCAQNVGHFNKDMSFNNMQEYAEFFDKKTGYWREGKGCILPRELRSYTCLGHFCDGEFSKKIDEVRKKSGRRRTK